MAIVLQDIGSEDGDIYAGDSLAIDFTITTGGSAAGVTAAEWALFREPPDSNNVGQSALFTRTIGNGVVPTDGTEAGTVVFAVDVAEGLTQNFGGLLYHQLRITASAETYVAARGNAWLRHRGV